MLLIIISIIIYILGTITRNKFTYRFLLENQTIELIWTIIPALILVLIILPSLKLLYLFDEINNSNVTIKSIGHQWYWSYELSDFKIKEFDSYIISLDHQINYNFRLLDVDNRLVLPFSSQIRLIVTSSDVIHSWTIPSTGLKIDAVPGRLNQLLFNINRTRLFFGQCSEICGTNHSFIPIVIERVSSENFIKWVNLI